MPKPKGTMGATKMKIMAIICHNCENSLDAYGYVIWQSLKNLFHMYLNDCDVRNVYHHLKELCELELLERIELLETDPSQRCLYQLTEKGRDLEGRYAQYLEIIRRVSGMPSNY